MKTKIYQLNIFDLPLTKTKLSYFMAQSFELIKKHQDSFIGIDEPLALFHNEEVKYTAIQYACKQGGLSLTAYGAKEIKALKQWWRLYKKNTGFNSKNKQEILEYYHLKITDKPLQYHVVKFLPSKTKSKELASLKNKKEYKLVLERYIMANFLPFFTHIGYRHDKDKNPITVKISKIIKHSKRFKGFKRASELEGYDIFFSANIVLPQTIRIGQNTAMGFGEIKRI